MNTKIFLERDSISDAEFISSIMAVCVNNGVKAKVLPAVKISGQKDTEIYGATVEANSWDLLKIVEGLKNASGNREVIVPITLENMPKGFSKAKYAYQNICGNTSGAKARMLGIAWDLQGILCKQWKENKVNDNLIIDADLENNLLSLVACSYPEENPDAWQKRMSALMKKSGDEYNLAFSYIYAARK